MQQEHLSQKRPEDITALAEYVGFMAGKEHQQMTSDWPESACISSIATAAVSYRWSAWGQDYAERRWLPSRIPAQQHVCVVALRQYVCLHPAVTCLTECVSEMQPRKSQRHIQPMVVQYKHAAYPVRHRPSFGMPLPSLQVIQLYCLICSMAGKQQVVAGFNGQSKAHEESTVDTHGCTK